MKEVRAGHILGRDRGRGPPQPRPRLPGLLTTHNQTQKPMLYPTDYAGDGVYVQYDGHAIILRANGITDATDVVVLEPETWQALQRIATAFFALDYEAFKNYAAEGHPGGRTKCGRSIAERLKAVEDIMNR